MRTRRKPKKSRFTTVHDCSRSELIGIIRTYLLKLDDWTQDAADRGNGDASDFFEGIWHALEHHLNNLRNGEKLGRNIRNSIRLNLKEANKMYAVAFQILPELQKTNKNINFNKIETWNQPQKH